MHGFDAHTEAKACLLVHKTREEAIGVNDDSEETNKLYVQVVKSGKLTVAPRFDAFHSLIR